MFSSRLRQAAGRNRLALAVERRRAAGLDIHDLTVSNPTRAGFAYPRDLLAPMANVPVVIFQYAMSPYDDWHRLAWAGAFVLTLFVLLVGLAARAIVARHRISHD